jgi:hypothetical protein
VVSQGGERCADGEHSRSAEAIGVATSGAGSSLTAQAFSSTIRASAAHPSGVEIQSLRSALVGVRTLTATSPSRGLSLSRYELVAHWWFHCSTMYGRSKAPGSTSSFWHLEAVAQDVNTFLVVVLIVLVGGDIRLSGLLELTDRPRWLAYVSDCLADPDASPAFGNFPRSPRLTSSIKWQ